MKQQLLPTFTGVPRKKPRVMMKVYDCHFDPRGTHGIKFQCLKCGHDTGWIYVDRTVSENKKGLPCPKCNSDQKMKPAFLALKTPHYNDFKRGLKQNEYRLFGGRFTEKNFAPGREITLSRGYGKQDRLCGVITSFKVVDLVELPSHDQEDIISCYGQKAETHPIAVIGIKLNA